MSNDKQELPDVPISWTKLVERLIVLVTLIASITSSVIAGCNNNRIGTVREHQDKNAAGLEEVKASAAAAHKEAMSLRKELTEKNK